jgi:hypothetical protein
MTAGRIPPIRLATLLGKSWLQFNENPSIILLAGGSNLANPVLDESHELETVPSLLVGITSDVMFVTVSAGLGSITWRYHTRQDMAARPEQARRTAKVTFVQNRRWQIVCRTPIFFFIWSYRI